MSADREQLIQLFEAKVQSFEALAGARFHALLPLKEGIIRLRAKKASCRTIAELLKQPASRFPIILSPAFAGSYVRPASARFGSMRKV